MQTDLITKVYFNEHLTHSCVGIPQGLQALSSSYPMIWCASSTIIPDYLFIDLLGSDLWWHVSSVDGNY